MAWISVHQHIKGKKLRDFAKDMKVHRAEALGLLVSLWLWGLDNADRDGNIGDVDAKEIAEACMYEGKRYGSLVAALIKNRWLDAGDDNLIIHDWDTWQDAWYKSLDRREANTIAVRRHRDRKKSLQSDNCNDYSKNDVIASPSPSPSPKDLKDILPYGSVRDAFLSLCQSLPKIKSLTEKRKTAIKARFNDGATLADFEEVFRLTEASDFLTGRSGKWAGADFDWILKPANWTKILEGNYANNRGLAPTTPPDKDYTKGETLYHAGG